MAYTRRASGRTTRRAAPRRASSAGGYRSRSASTSRRAAPRRASTARRTTRSAPREIVIRIEGAASNPIGRPDLPSVVETPTKKSKF